MPVAKDELNLASCCCGQCQIQVLSKPALNSVCNCNDCKKRTGSAFGHSSYFYNQDVNIVKDASSVYQVNNEFGSQQRHFCRNCGTTLFWYLDAFKGLTGIAGGCFTDNPLPQPNFNAMKQNQCPWLTFASEMDKALTASDIPIL